MDPAERLRVFGKKYSIEILAAIDEPRTAQEVSDELDIPIATCYRRVQELEEHGLLEVHGTKRTAENRPITVYHRNTDTVRITFENSLSVALAEQHTATGKLESVWRQLSDRFPTGSK